MVCGRFLLPRASPACGKGLWVRARGREGEVKILHNSEPVDLGNKSIYTAVIFVTLNLLYSQNCLINKCKANV